ncbi:MAG: outer membrane lipoprotein-sorting protein [Proteobacteria bacterium]|nr:outer membrane lipoprotein-sorting protein [Pseudomonadota bacterium]
MIDALLGRPFLWTSRLKVPAIVGLAVLVCLGVPSIAPSATPEEAGLQIAKEADLRAQGFGNFTARQTMILRNKQGQESRREIRVRVLEVEGDGDKSLFVFDEPRDVKGTAFLIHAHQQDDDDQWLYLPALKRVKRISSSNRSGSFMGSEFAYEDLGAPEVEKFSYRFLRDEPCGELTCAVSERVPTDRKSGYSRQLVWQDREELRIWKVEYYDRKDAHLKTLTTDGYQQFLERFWQPGEMSMVNHLTGKSTVLTWTDYQFGTELNERDFSQTGLRRVR